ncbi:hypothetical protein [Actinomycetospora straminea]|uniref:Dolichyl-phosphate-mannose-protein mannosyltransferase n=1 Tax=Actinomycetospora straminea TaxID=663607 RepID=A0ABP9E555_9PSEU|nr:hypothetical protein [Actinomycetospora straminea]MDD7934644.1 hypothetical protein [Actinomycetospora straminea]
MGSTAPTPEAGLAASDPPPRRRGPRPSDVLAAAYGAAMGALLSVVAGRALPDDAMITLSYARNLAERGEWALTPGVAANTATSPLNVWLEAGLVVVTGRPELSVGILLALTVGLLALCLHRQHGAPVCGAGVLLLVANPFLASATGLEVYLTALAIVALVWAASAGHFLVLGIVGGLAVLTRPDLAIVVLAVVVLAAARHRRVGGALLALALAGIVAAPWHVWSWLRFGSAVPDTLAVKADAGDSWGGYTYGNGIGHYLGYWPEPTRLVVAGLAVGLVAWLACLVQLVRHRHLGPRGWSGLAFGVAGGAHYAAMSALGGAPFFWYYTPAVVGAALATVVVADAALRPVRPLRSHTPVRIAAGALAGLAVVGIAGATLVQDAERGVPWSGFAPVRVNWATPAQYEAIAAALPPGSTVESPGEIGYLAFHCRCRVVDYFSDPGRMAPAIDRFRADHDGPIWRLNYLHRRPQAPVPAAYRLVYEAAPPDGPGQWPVTFPGDRVKRMRLEALAP